MVERKITFEILKLLDEKDGRGGKVRLQVVRWNDYSPVLEKREYYEKDGEERSGKTRGFNFEDFQIILDNSEDIQKILEKDDKKKFK